MRTLTALVFALLLAGSVPVAWAQQTAPPGVDVPSGYAMEAAVTGLDYPTAIASWKDQHWVSEAGHLPSLPPKVKHIDSDGNATTILTPEMLPAGMLLGPLTDVTYHNGWLWMTHRQKGANNWNVGAISRFQPDDPAGTFQTVITNLPSSGDHHTDEILFDEAGRAYFSVGSATNASVVGPDNYRITGWLQNPDFRNFHDFPAKDVTLNGQDFETPVPFPLDPEADDVTAPFHPFGSGPVDPGTVVEGATPSNPQDGGIIAGNGTIYSFDPSAASPTSTIQLEAWGLRNPYGIGLDPFNPGVLFSTNNGADTRGVAGETSGPIEEEKIVGSRPIEEDYDDLFMLDVGDDEEFFGWPDYFHNEESGAVMPVTAPIFCGEEGEKLEDCPEFVLDEDFRNSLNTQPAFSQLGYHTSANKFDFSMSGRFGFSGDLFVAETGSFIPITGAVNFTGYKVVRVDRATGEVSDFIVNTGETADELFDPASFNKPIDVKFNQNRMMMVDFGVFEPGLGRTQAGTGKVWMVANTDIEELAAVTFEDQQSDGRSVTVSSVSLPDGGFVTIYESPLPSDLLDGIIGVSDYLEPGMHEDIEITLFGDVPGQRFDKDRLTEDQTLIAMPHRDTNGNQAYDFIDLLTQQDWPYLDAEENRITDSAEITVTGEVTDNSPPECGNIEVLTDNGVGVAVQTTATDAESRIASVTFTRLFNLTGQLNGEGDYSQDDIKTFEDPPETVTIRGNRQDMNDNRAALVTVVENGAGLTSTCDPVIETVAAEAPEQFALEANYPNPFNPTTTIPFEVAEPTHVTLTVYDVMGREVARLVDREMSAGSYEAKWNARDAAGQRVSSGVYIYRIEAGTYSATQQMTLVK